MRMQIMGYLSSHQIIIVTCTKLVTLLLGVHLVEYVSKLFQLPFLRYLTNIHVELSLIENTVDKYLQEFCFLL